MNQALERWRRRRRDAAQAELEAVAQRGSGTVVVGEL
jgi:hypothetical protein